MTPNESLLGKTIVVTGASRGLGAGMADRFLQRGANVGLCARGPCSVAAEAAVLSRQLDVCDRAAMDDFAKAVRERFGPIDLWINNAGVLEPICFVRDLSSAKLQEHLAVNLLGVLHGAQAFLEQRGEGDATATLVNISSGAARKGYAGWGAYCAGKAAVDRLTECIQLEEATKGIRAFSVAPGVIDTGMQELIRSSDPRSFPMREKFVQLKKDNAFNEPNYVADCLAELAFGDTKAEKSVAIRLPSQPRQS